jgi:coproporphyrinogen III oxidase-like Fe-S oxidoreductase
MKRKTDGFGFGQEIQMRKTNLKWSVETIYFGGGTPERVNF